MIRKSSGIVAAVLIVAASSEMFAQTSSGTFGSRTFGTGVSGSASSRNQGLTQSGQLSSSAAIQRDSGAFVGAGSGGGNIRSVTGGTGFGIGASSPLGFSTIGSGLGNSFGFMNFGRGNNATQQTTNLNNNQQAPIRTTLTLGFRPPAVGPTTVSRHFKLRLGNIRQIGAQSAKIDVNLEGRTAILRGVVESEQARDLAERLALLEPGISSVENQLTVAPPASELPLLPPLPIPEP